MNIFLILIFLSSVLTISSDSKCRSDNGDIIYSIVLFSYSDSNLDCNDGVCLISGICKCDKGYFSYSNQNCKYEQRKKIYAFILSLFLGIFGADWFYLAVWNNIYFIVGILKLLAGIFAILFPCFICFTGCVKADSGKIIGFLCVVLLIIFITIGNIVWWLADVIRILVDTFKDGNGQNLLDWWTSYMFIEFLLGKLIKPHYLFSCVRKSFNFRIINFIPKNYD